MTYVDVKLVAGHVFSRLKTSQRERARINRLRPRIHVTYLPQNALIVVNRAAAYMDKQIFVISNTQQTC